MVHQGIHRIQHAEVVERGVGAVDPHDGEFDVLGDAQVIGFDALIATLSPVALEIRFRAD